MLVLVRTELNNKQNMSITLFKFLQDFQTSESLLVLKIYLNFGDPMSDSDNVSLNPSIFISMNDRVRKNEDLRRALKKTLTGKVNLEVFQDASRDPEQIFDATIKAILLCDGALLDACVAQPLSPDILIQFGICYALGKHVRLISVSENKNLDSVSVLENHVINFHSYVELTETFEQAPLEWNEHIQEGRVRQQAQYQPKNSLSFSVFGAKDDVRSSIKQFAWSENWMPRFNRQIDSVLWLENLAREIGARSFCIFCIENLDDVEVLVGTGLAIGMGIPFLVVQNRSVPLPDTLHGYRAILDYDQCFELEQHLSNYKEEFFTRKVTQWNGATFHRMIAWGDALLKKATKQTELFEAQRLFDAVIASVYQPIPEAYAGLADSYIVYYETFGKGVLQLLFVAKKIYEEGLRVDAENNRCKSGLKIVIEKIEKERLLHEEEGNSIQSLIRVLVGENLTPEQYDRKREFLFKVVKELMIAQEHLDALSLLSAMRVYDSESDELKKQIQEIFERAPNAIKEELYRAQEYIRILHDQLSSHRSQLQIIGSHIGTLVDTNKNTGRAVVVKFFDDLGWGLYIGLNNRPIIEQGRIRDEADEGRILEHGDIVHHGGIPIQFLLGEGYSRYK